MLLHADPSLAEVPGFNREQLDALARSVELRRQQLEDDIQAYIRSKQAELRSHEQELVARYRYRSMECDGQDPAPADPTCPGNAEATAISPAALEPSAHSSPAPEPEDKTRQKKHSRVHKREKELYGLVTPAFLPLLDARDASPEKKKKKPQPQPQSDPVSATSPSDAAGSGAPRDAEKGKESRMPNKDSKDMENTASGALGKENQPADATKKSKRSPMKKSALRHKDTPRSRRKRVSLIIDGQTVLPADTVPEQPLTSPSSEATSASNSTTSLDDMIDPRLTAEDAPANTEHRDALHHSLPLPMSSHIHASTKPLVETPTPVAIAPSHSSPSLHTQSIPFSNPRSATRTFLDPSPTQHTRTIPETAGPDPIYSTTPATPAELETVELADEEQHFDTYVGGLHGSGVDDVDQAGSYGYPSSLGASYMESYMQNRPLSVRMQAANKAGLDDEEKRKLVEEEDDEEGEGEEDEDFGGERERARARNAAHVDEDNFMGDMDDF
ncbi:hypothetical protein BDW02DRAFT_572869 [Decorospora gaudefroyi]|uniref:Uncharacterized protein n=1 Tax=Decorospora gaudefroyi TaxID=184978 RepID=A0A6A5K3C5_9PLEO|nr:hypothetical protein BDW02DRAFT_572869 [Decorospora gaudefroyi]